MTGLSEASVQNRIGYLYETVAGAVIMGFVNLLDVCAQVDVVTISMLSACGLFPDIRDCFYRERSDGLYKAGVFIFSYTLHALPTDIGSVILFSLWGFVSFGCVVLVSRLLLILCSYSL